MAVGSGLVRLFLLGAAGAAIVSCASLVNPGSGGGVLEHRLAAADELVERGCYVCLTEAVRTYEGLLDERRSKARVSQKIHEAYLMLAIRERELGIEDSGAGARAYEVVTRPSVPRDTFISSLETLFEHAQQAGLDRARVEHAFAARDRVAWREERSPRSIAAAYLHAALECQLGASPAVARAPAPASTASPERGLALRYGQLRCPGSFSAGTARDILRAEPRFGEAHLALGLHAMHQGLLVTAHRELSVAHRLIPESTAISLALADAALALSRFGEALRLYDAVVAANGSPGAFIGRAKALTYLRRHAEAITQLDELLRTSEWNRGVKYYWRAWNRLQASDPEGAHEDALEALRSWAAPHAYRLAGVTAFTLGHLAEARRHLDSSLEMSADDCESLSYLAQVDSVESKWPAAFQRFAAAASCFERAIEGLLDVGASDASAAEIARVRKLRASSNYNAAVSAKACGRRDVALAYARRALDSEEYGSLAKDFILDIDIPMPINVSGKGSLD